MKKTVHERFTEKVSVVDGDGCYLWTASKFKNGYGQFFVSMQERAAYAHRVAWSLHHGKPIPKGMCVLHSCDVRACVRPEHLFLGSFQDNVDDMVSKGRNHFGGPGPYVIQALEENLDQILEMRANEVPMKRIAEHFNCTGTTIKRLLAKHNVYAPLRPGPRVPFNIFTKGVRDHTEILLERFSRGETVNSIANSMGVGWRTMNRIISKSQKSAILSSHNQNL